MVMNYSRNHSIRDSLEFTLTKIYGNMLFYFITLYNLYIYIYILLLLLILRHMYLSRLNYGIYVCVYMHSHITSSKLAYLEVFDNYINCHILYSLTINKI
uniref:Uncharacterized protein n=1 Tax=Heterorhabditis bacteriophora TaxID=37862 RepID=A0A1I7WWX9_HETBA